MTALGLVAVVPGPAFRAYHEHQAGELVERAEGGRPDVLASMAVEGKKLEGLGEPVRAWSAVSCSLSPRYSDGDGEQDVVVLYHQVCAPVAFQVYALRPGQRTLRRAALAVNGRVGEWEHDCDESILDVTSLGLGELGDDGGSMDLRWVAPSGNGEGDCTLPTPGMEGETQVETSLDQPARASSYVVLSVFGAPGKVDVGCERKLLWLGSCTSTPDGAPYL